MKQFMNISLITILTLLITSYSFFAQEQGINQKDSGKAEAGMVYQCPTHLGVISNVSGRCSKCDSELIELTMDEAMDNLAGGGKKKPELKLKKIKPDKKETSAAEEIVVSDTSGNIEEEAVELNNEESGHNHTAEHEKNVAMTDLNRDGYVYQCPNCPDQLSDESDDCEECFSDYVRVTVEEAKKHIPVCDH